MSLPSSQHLPSAKTALGHLVIFMHSDLGDGEPVANRTLRLHSWLMIS